jgi:catechol 2,3-dioxygenase-like lactoylglutathione lyase family enzyme
VGEVLVKAEVYHLQINVRDATVSLHRKRTGLNHVALRVPEREDVDRVRSEFMAPRKPGALYRTPREFPEYRPGYYAVFFEDPDRLKVEVVHIPAAPGP